MFCAETSEEPKEEEAPSMPPLDTEQPAGDLTTHLIKLEDEEQKSLQAATDALGGLSTHESGKLSLLNPSVHVAIWAV